MRFPIRKVNYHQETRMTIRERNHMVTFAEYERTFHMHPNFCVRTKRSDAYEKFVHIRVRLDRRRIIQEISQFRESVYRRGILTPSSVHVGSTLRVHWQFMSFQTCRGVMCPVPRVR
jgi:hypothetical protein